MTEIHLDGNYRPYGLGLYRFEKENTRTVWRKYDEEGWCSGEFELPIALTNTSRPGTHYVERAVSRGYKVYFECYLDGRKPYEPRSPQQLELF